MLKSSTFLVMILFLFQACSPSSDGDAGEETPNASEPSEELTGEWNLLYEGEKHFANVRQLTDGGDNAEAYFSFDDKKLVMQIAQPEKGIECDQIFYLDLSEDGMPGLRRVSNGKGRTTCSYFMPGDQRVLYASTHEADENCPEVPERTHGGPYVWPIYPGYDIYVSNLEGEIIEKLTDEPGYDAEATLSPDGSRIVFTSMRSGDLELYTMNTDGSDVVQITDELGYDGGAFYSPDGSKIIFRASRPETEEEQAQYKELIAKNLVQPTEMELFLCNADGSDLKQITDLGNANWAPFFHPSGEKIIFSSNYMSERGFPFNLFMINIDGSGLGQITFDEAFDSFPMFSRDGKKLVFSSNRNNGGTRATNVFIADWVE